MKYLFFLVASFILTSCFVNQQVKYDPFDYSDEELSLLASIMFLENNLDMCNDTCAVKVSSKFEYFDTCFDSYFDFFGGEEAKDYGYNKDKAFAFRDFTSDSKIGTILFRSNRNDIDYYFTPILIDRKNKILRGGVKGEIG